MEQSQLIELVKTIQRDEKEHLLQFCTLKYFNGGRMRLLIGPLLEICLNQPWHLPDHKLNKEKVYEALFPDQVWVDGKLEKVMVEAQKVVRAFLLNQYYFREENEFNQVFDFSKILRLRGLESRFKLTIARLKIIQEESTERSEQYYHQQYLLEEAIHCQECVENQSKGDLHIPRTMDAAVIYYHVCRLALLNRYLLQLMVTKFEIPDLMKLHLEDVHIPAEYLEESPLLRINCEVYRILKKKLPETSDVQLLFDLLRRYEKMLDGDSLSRFYGHIRNFAVLIVTADRDKMDICYTLHELYVDNLERGYLHYEGKLPPARYYAVSDNALRVKQLDWAIAFIEKYKNDIYGENETNDMYRFVKANYLFTVGRFSECLDILPSNSSFVAYLLLGKRMEIKALYELQSDLLSYKLDAFKMYLSRTSTKILSDTQRQIHVDFANYFTQIMTSIPGDVKRSELVYKRIKENKQVAERTWLLAKALALKGRHAEK